MLPANAQVPPVPEGPVFFLKLTGIEGESTDKKHIGEIQIDSWNWGETKPAGANDQPTAPVNMQDFNFFMQVSKATPKLFSGGNNGETIKQAVLTVRNEGTGIEFLKWTLTDVQVTSYQANGFIFGTPSDQISLKFSKIEVQYTVQNPDGSPGETVKAGWDVAANKSL